MLIFSFALGTAAKFQGILTSTLIHFLYVFISILAISFCIFGIGLSEICLLFSDNFKKLKQLKSKVTKWNSERSILIHTEDGLGDVLMTLPTAKTYKERGYKVYYVVNPVMSSIFNNLDFVDKVYTRLDYSPVKLVTYFFETTHKLSNYGKDWNQQNRIYSTAFLCGLTPKDLTIQKPILVLSKEEKDFASNLLKNYKNTVAISWHAVGTNRTYPYKNVLQLIDLLKDKGYFPMIVDTHVADFKNKCLDLTNKLIFRPLLADSTTIPGLSFSQTIGVAL